MDCDTAPRLSVLVIEDDIDHQLLVRLYLETNGMKAHVVPRLVELERILHARPDEFDCVVVDLNLPGSYPGAALDTVLALTDVPVVVMTTMIAPEARVLVRGRAPILQKSLTGAAELHAALVGMSVMARVRQHAA